MTEPRRIVLLLAASVGLMMTGFGIIMPVFARRLGELGGGVSELGIMTMVFGLAHMVLSPIAGGFSDRVGRRPLILLGLGGFALSNALYLLAPSTGWFIGARALAGVLTAGLYPAAMAVVDDISDETQRASRVGLVMAGYGIGFVLGPVIGGVLYDAWGFAAPFVLSGALGVAGLCAAAILIPETRRAASRSPAAESKARLGWLPRPLFVLAVILATELTLTFAFAYIEPQMVFYVYDELGWSTAQFGIIAGCYGIALALAQALLSKSSDRLGRKPVILLGLSLTLALYVGLATITSFAPMMAAAFLAGLGTGLVGPALSALLLDVTTAGHRGRVMGLKSSASSTGGVLGPLAVALVSGALAPTAIFLSAAAVVLTIATLAAAALPGRGEPLTAAVTPLPPRLRGEPAL